MAAPLVSVVIVNWNGIGFLKECLKSLHAQGGASFEAIVVDNGSSDGSADYVRREYPEARIIENRENLGFARANNQGIAEASGKYVLTLNNDAVLGRGFLKTIVQAAEESREGTGMWAPKILSIDEEGLIDSAGGLLIYPDGLARGRGRGSRDSGQYDGRTDAFIPSACAALYRKRMLDDVGLFDEDFFAYCEDTDLGFRARLAGWGAAYVPSAVVFHHYSATGGKYTPFKAYLVARNHVWVAVKNFPPGRLFFFFFYMAWRYLYQAASMAAGSGAAARFAEGFSAVRLVGIVLKAHWHAIRSLPSVLAKRRANVIRVDRMEVKRWFRRYGITAREATKD